MTSTNHLDGLILIAAVLASTLQNRSRPRIHIHNSFRRSRRGRDAIDDDPFEVGRDLFSVFLQGPHTLSKFPTVDLRDAAIFRYVCTEDCSASFDSITYYLIFLSF